MADVTMCAICATTSTVDARFCHQCGSPVGHTDSRAEYKQVTVLFADTVQSMHLAAAVGAERLREIMAALVDCAAAVVHRHGGRLDKFTGDGIMALFGAPVALEDHAERACRAALELQHAITDLIDEVAARDCAVLALRIGLNSGQVITGEIGSAAMGYTAVGEQVGMAQRMESVAPPGGVMLSPSTARLVEGSATLAAPELLHIKGRDQPVRSRRLLDMRERQRDDVSEMSTMVGRHAELDVAEALLARAVDGQGTVLTIMGSPGLGKSRLVREIAGAAAARELQVFSAYCESHTSDIAFHVVARILRAATGVRGMDGAQARAHVRAGNPDADPEDLALFEDLLGIADTADELPQIDPEARRRRLTALVNAASISRTSPAVFVIEDAHWIDAVSESMLADFVAVIPQTPSLVVITYRPGYAGALSRIHDSQAIELRPLNDADSTMLVTELVGTDSSIWDIAALVTDRAAGNPFFAQEIVRDLAERGVLQGERGACTSSTPSVKVSVPDTIQATIAARIDRLTPDAKRTLCAAAVIGSRFSTALLRKLGVEPDPDDLVAGEFIRPVTSNANYDYSFYHPLIRTVAYETQLKTDRADLHRRVAGAIEAQGSPDADAALIAEHLEAAGESAAAYGWRMRSASWATNRDISAARASWERAQEIADRLPQNNPTNLALRIIPRTMLCGTAFRADSHISNAQFEELRRLCDAAGDRASLCIGMIGLVVDRAFQARLREASQLASEAMVLVQSLHDTNLTAGLSFAAIYAKMEAGDWAQVLRWSQQVIDAADGDPSKGNFIIGSPLAAALTSRAVANYCLGRPGWPADLRHALTMARSVDPTSYARAITYIYTLGVPGGVLAPDDTAIRDVEDALREAERSGDNHALAIARMTEGLARVHRPSETERNRGLEILEEFLREAHNRGELPIAQIYVARERARLGRRTEAVELMRSALSCLTEQGQLAGWGVPATAVLVETLLDKPGETDLAEAQAVIEQLAAATTSDTSTMVEMWMARMRTLVALATRDNRYTQFRYEYLTLAHTHGFHGHMSWATAMPPAMS